MKIRTVTALMLAVVGLASLPLTSCSDDNDEILQDQPDEYTFGPRRVFSRLWSHTPEIPYLTYDEDGLLKSFSDFNSYTVSVGYHRDSDGNIVEVTIDYPGTMGISGINGEYKLCTVLIGENGFASEIVEESYTGTSKTVYRPRYNDRQQLAGYETVETDQRQNVKTTDRDAVYADGNLVSLGGRTFEYSSEPNKCGYFGLFLFGSNAFGNPLVACYYAGLLGMPPSRTMMSAVSYVDNTDHDCRFDYEWDLSDGGYPVSLDLYRTGWNDFYQREEEHKEYASYWNFFNPDVRSSRALWQGDMSRHR